MTYNIKRLDKLISFNYENDKQLVAILDEIIQQLITEPTLENVKHKLEANSYLTQVAKIEVNKND